MAWPSLRQSSMTERYAVPTRKGRVEAAALPPLLPGENPVCYLAPRRLVLSAWSLHVPFAMYLVDLLRPRSIVELGTRKGVSYCAFCQAVQYLGISASCAAVDSWSGDAHTGAYGAAVLDNLRRHHDPLYGGFSRLHQCLFHEALAEFPNGSIDLLHIDGLHTYDAVRSDFESWLPRVSPQGVILFHDVAEHRQDFGVWRFWAEVTQQYPSFTFEHGHGLGVLGVGAALPQPVAQLLHADQAEARQIREFFLRQGRWLRIRTIVEAAFKCPGNLFVPLLEASRAKLRRSALGA